MYTLTFIGLEPKEITAAYSKQITFLHNHGNPWSKSYNLFDDKASPWEKHRRSCRNSYDWHVAARYLLIFINNVNFSHCKCSSLTKGCVPYPLCPPPAGNHLQLQWNIKHVFTRGHPGSGKIVHAPVNNLPTPNLRAPATGSSWWKNTPSFNPEYH